MTIVSDHSSENPWYVEVFLALGGWLAGLLAAIAIGAFAAAIVADMGNNAIEAASILALLIGASFVFMGIKVHGPARAQSSSNDFTRHFSIASIAAGLTAGTLGVWYLVYELVERSVANDPLAAGASGLITAALLGSGAVYVSRFTGDAILTFLVTLATYAITVAALLIMMDGAAISWHPGHYFSAIALTFGAWLFVSKTTVGLHRPTAAALMIGSMFYYALISEGNLLFGGRDDTHQSPIIADMILIGSALYCLLALPSRFQLVPVIAATAVITAGIWLLPNAGGVAIVILLAGIAANHRGLSVVGVIAVAWFIGQFYYDLSMTLMEKSVILTLMGAITLGGTLAFHRFKRKAAQDGASTHRTERRSALAVVAFAAVLAVGYAKINHSVWRLETAFDDAQTIYLPLGPRDPRSLIQGDYMVLRFRATIYPDTSTTGPLPNRGEVFLTLDENAVASFSRVAEETDTPRPDEIRIDYVKTRNTRMRYCPESFFFQEGEAAKYQPARFAIIKVAPDGRTQLIGLADENRASLGKP